ncbi:unnamed protein product [Urochloa humidicola]
MVVADLGCSSGPNTVLVIDEVMSTLRDCAREEMKKKMTDNDSRRAMQAVQFFLNDLPGNDFNLLFRSLQQLQDFDVEEEDGITVALPCYIAGLPGSFYRRLFPCQTVHLFHSSYSLMWRSKVPEQLSCGSYVNDGNIYIGESTPPTVVKLFQEQFQKDFKLFLALRYKELVGGGRMVLTFLGRNTEMLTHGEVGSMWELFAKALQSLVQKGLVEKEKLNSFSLPFYAPSMEEVKALIKEDHFDIERITLFESNWDPLDDSNSDVVLDSASSGRNVANKSIRAVMEPLIIDHFGEAVLDELFMVFASMVAKHLEIRKAKYPVIVVSLKKVICIEL